MKKIQIFLNDWLPALLLASAICIYVIIAGGNAGFKKLNELQTLKEIVVKR